MTDQPKHKGIRVTVGDRELIVPPLTLGALDRLQETIEKFDGSLNAETVPAVIAVVKAALDRNYTDITEDWLKENVDLGNMVELFQATMDVSGIGRIAQEAAAASPQEASPVPKPQAPAEQTPSDT